MIGTLYLLVITKPGTRSMQKQEIERLLSRVEHKDWRFKVDEKGESLYIQVIFRDAGGDIQHGRKFILSTWMTKSEIVQTALKAVLAVEEHEAREQFKYLGHSIFGPHYDVDALVEVCMANRIDAREVRA